MDCKHPFSDYFHLLFHAIKWELMFLLGYCAALSSEKRRTFFVLGHVETEHHGGWKSLENGTV